MTTYNLIRSTLAASLCLSVLAACDGRGVTAMKSRMYTAEERAHARRALGDKSGSLKGDKTPAKTADTSVVGEDPAINPLDYPEMKNYFERSDAAGKHATTSLANVMKLIKSSGILTGEVNQAAQERVLGVTVDNLSQNGKSMIGLSAVVKFRGIEHNLVLRNLSIDPVAKDLVNGTADVKLEFASPSVESVKAFTTNDLLISSVCLDVSGTTCTHAYLLIQFGRQSDDLIDAAVIELGPDMSIANTNFGMPPLSFKQAQDKLALQDVPPAAPATTPAASATVEALKREQLFHQSFGTQPDPFAKVAPAASAPAAAKPAVTPAQPAAAAAPATVAPAASIKPAAQLPTKDQLVRQTLGQPNDPFAHVKTPPTGTSTATKAAAPAKQTWGQFFDSWNPIWGTWN